MIANRIRTLTVEYGPHASQSAEVLVPRGAGPHPVVVLLHGGLWRRGAPGLESMRPIARHLVRHGFAVVNLEYRRVGEQGAGWPGTFLDAVDGAALAGRPLRLGRAARRTHVLDTDRVAIVGHCSGGHLALWAAAWLCGLWLGPEWIGPSRDEVDGAEGVQAVAAGQRPKASWNQYPNADGPGARPDRISVRAVVALAPVTDLRAAERDGLDLPAELVLPEEERPAAAALLGGSPVAVAGRYRLGSPLDLLPVGREVAQLLVHGDADDIVPVEHSLRYARSAQRSGDRVRVGRFPGMGHFDMLDPAHEAWQLAFRHLREHLDN